VHPIVQDAAAGAPENVVEDAAVGAAQGHGVPPAAGRNEPDADRP
jgi:hypothetical protein